MPNFLFASDADVGNESGIIEPNFRASIIPSDVYYSNQWYLKKIKAEEAWNIKREANDIVVAVVDSGVNISHPDLKENIWRNLDEIPDNRIDDDNNGFVDDYFGWDFVGKTPDPTPKFSKGFTIDGIIHGTVVAGIIAGYGNNGIGISGVLWQANIMPLKVLDDAGAGETVNVIKAIDYAVANGADIINLSFVGTGFSQGLENAIRRAYEKGIVVVAAAGNDQGGGLGVNTDETALYPACHDGKAGENMVVGVSATDPLDQKAPFSSYGSNCVDIAAPGVSIFSTAVFSPQHNDFTPGSDVFSRYYDGYWSGTSMAAPLVSGAIALIESANPRLSQKGATRVLADTADSINRLNPGYENKLGRGRLNVFEAVKRAKAMINGDQTFALIGPMGGADPILKIIDSKGRTSKEIEVFEKKFQGGFMAVSAKLDKDDQAEIVVAAGAGGGSEVKIFDVSGTSTGQFLAFGKNFRPAVSLAAGDIDGDGKDEIIVGAGSGGGPQIRVFRANGSVINQFFAYDKNFRGGVSVAAGDVDGDGKDEIITGAGPGGGPHVRVFRVDGSLVGQFFAYDKNFRGGVKVASAYFNSGAKGNQASIVTAPGHPGAPHIVVYDPSGHKQFDFYAFEKKFRGGINISTGDFDNDGFDEIVAGAGPGGSPHIRIFDKIGVLKSSFYGLDGKHIQGVNVGVIDIAD